MLVHCSGILTYPRRWPGSPAENAISLHTNILWFSQYRKHSYWTLGRALTVEQMRYLSLCQVFIGQSSCCVCIFEYDPVYVHSIMRSCCATHDQKAFYIYLANRPAAGHMASVALVLFMRLFEL